MTRVDGELDFDYLRSWIGSEDIGCDVVTEDMVRKFNMTFDIQDQPPRIGAPSPGLIHYCLAPAVVSTANLGPDGHPRRGGFLPPVPLPRRMWAGSRVTFHRRISVGDRVRRTSRISEVAVKRGRSGPLVFINVEHILDVNQSRVIEETQDLVYRGFGGTLVVSSDTAKETPNRRLVDVSAPFLFRYSAITFNGHRIHYDREYATGVEGYPGLVVHGPLQATLLLNHATAIRGAAPFSFSFRSESPVFDTEPFFLDASEDGNKMTLWSSRAGGPVAMRAEAAWS